jgi:GWxTD domain-containing protein
MSIMAGAVVQAAPRTRPAFELINPALGPSYAQWLVGPIARMASREEIDAYLGLQGDEAARDYIDQFWRRRDPDPDRYGNEVRELFEKRAAEADKKYSEAAHTGRRTDRGTIHVLYGTPESTEYALKKNAWDPDVEVWKYPKKAEPGLDGRRPDRTYRFARQGEVTTFYSPRNRAGPRDRIRDPRLP